MDSTAALLLMALIVVVGGFGVVTVCQYTSGKRKTDDNDLRDQQLKAVAEVARQAIEAATGLTHKAIEGNIPDRNVRDLGWIDAREGNGQPVQQQRSPQHSTS